MSTTTPLYTVPPSDEVFLADSATRQLFARATTRYMSENPGTIQEQAEALMLEALRFYALCAANEGMTFTPSDELDEALHTLTLYTLELMGFCSRIAGRSVFMVHQPFDIPGREVPTGGAQTTRGVLETLGVEYDSRFWPSSSASGDPCDYVATGDPCGYVATGDPTTADPCGYVAAPTSQVRELVAAA